MITTNKTLFRCYKNTQTKMSNKMQLTITSAQEEITVSCMTAPMTMRKTNTY